MASEFEKDVRRTMDGLKLHPSDKVWQRVEERIRENKKRRRILFFILFSLIGLTFAGYGIFNLSGRSNLKSDIVNVRASDTPGEAQKNSTRETSNDQEENIDITPAPTRVIKDEMSVENLMFAETSGGNKRSTKTKNQANDGKRSEGVNSAPMVSSTKNGGTKADTMQNEESNHRTSSDKSILANPVNEGIANDDLKSVTANDTTERPPLKKAGTKHPGKWRWGIDVSLGASNITQEPFSFKGSPADISASSAPVTLTGYLSGGPTGVIYGPSESKPSFAFKTGIRLKNEISPRSSVSIGLSYVYLADKIKIGTGQVSSQLASASRSGFYSAAPQMSYTEHFHFIELPVIYDWRISKNSSRYFSLTAGMSGSYLVSTNALVYDTTQHGIYYHGNSLFTRMHFNLMAGTAYHVTTTRKFELAVGPQFSFDLTKFIDSDVDKRKYFLYIGLDTRIFPGRAKNK